MCLFQRHPFVKKKKPDTPHTALHDMIIHGLNASKLYLRQLFVCHAVDNMFKGIIL